ncbi:uridylate kinase [Buchnera aphidicola str. Bp (Baizongia pistaciae)]|uniref:Uridylate kinase n=1 Tax=Buchnera aphidicola subsp. Baizongia pistaciae (strain Bp) TaxID=224915 RepID=PYRH_BUCBP|nr:UMP kinase [Buchnera aphidicola]P59578.1 RecName: Full=Uridylate kinase; Short=UK; AltName: Full=Uridine monophosphate kinase; Short=UMP kinase; Short=UMPK [Buchnera aphidicola str. Bp (Baizongia pistaciae)]AAO26947.1 uridylate kinase [Buchnera aphidicola str. Bp (Baizongia pistaciae)]
MIFSNNKKLKFKRVIIKLSGEALQGVHKFGIDIIELNRIAKEIKAIFDLGVQIGIVIGGGNIFRGKKLAKFGINKVISDYVGMLSTIMNGLLLCDSMDLVHLSSCLMSSICIDKICEQYSFKKALSLLRRNKVVVFSGGLGNPFFTTDSAACLRAIEMRADIVLKGTKVNGVYSSDPKKSSNSILYKNISYNEVLQKELKVMDLAAFALARDHKLPICIFNINKPNALYYIVTGQKEGTLIR